MKKFKLLSTFLLIAVVGTALLVGCGDKTSGENSDKNGGSVAVTDIKDLTQDVKPESIVSQQVDKETWNNGMETLRKIYVDLNYFNSQDNDTGISSYTATYNVWYNPEYSSMYNKQTYKFGKDAVSFKDIWSEDEETDTYESAIKKEDGKWSYVGEPGGDILYLLTQDESRDIPIPNIDYDKFTYDSEQKAYVVKNIFVEFGKGHGYNGDIAIKFLNNIPIYCLVVYKVEDDDDEIINYYNELIFYDFNKTTVDLPTE